MELYTIIQYGLIFLLFLVFLIHLLILLKIIPYTMVWSGRLQADEEMYRFEIVSLLVNALFIFLTLIHFQWIEISIPSEITRIGLWIMGILFALNTVGNLFSKNPFEKCVYTPITILLMGFCFVLVLNL